MLLLVPMNTVSCQAAVQEACAVRVTHTNTRHAGSSFMLNGSRTVCTYLAHHINGSLVGSILVTLAQPVYVVCVVVELGCGGVVVVVSE